MPTLRNLKCELEWGNSRLPIPEHGTKYADGLVETFVAIPDQPQPFAVHLTSTRYIADGLAMIVFMDGDYQCNRNRLGMKASGKKSTGEAGLVDLRVRQKEKPLGDGVYLGRSWRFDRHNLVPVDQLPPNVDRHHFLAIGTISVLVLRCQSTKTPVRNLSMSSNIDDNAPEISNGPDAERPSHHGIYIQPSVESEIETLGGFMNDGAADVSRFGLDGEGPGIPRHQTTWSWNTPVPVQPSYLSSMPYLDGHASGLYPTYSSAFPQAWQPGPSVHHETSDAANHRSQRHVHFTDEQAQPPPGGGGSAQVPTGSSDNPTPQNPQPQPTQQPNGAWVSSAPTFLPTAGPYIHPSSQPPNVASAPHSSQGVYFQPVNVPAQPSVNSFQPPPSNYPGYPVWPNAVPNPPHAQSAFSSQPPPAPSYIVPPNFAPPSPASNPFPHPVSAYPPGFTLPAQYPPSQHPGGGVWGPPASSSSQIPHQTDFRQDPSEARDQGWGQTDASQIHTGAGDWNGGMDGGSLGQKADTFHQKADQTETNDSNWGQPAANETAAWNDGTSSWQDEGNQNTPAQDWNNSDPWTMPAEDSTTQDASQRSSGHPGGVGERTLWGPYGVYYRPDSLSAAGCPKPDAGEEPPYDVPADMPTTHQVKPGEGYSYYHKRRSPDHYIDTLDEPYAHFIFRYRTKDQIEQETGLRVEDTGELDGEDVATRRQHLQTVEKEQLVEMLLQSQISAGRNSAPCLSQVHSPYNGDSTIASAIPAPTYNFLDRHDTRKTDQSPAVNGITVRSHAVSPGPTEPSNNATSTPNDTSWADNSYSAPTTTAPTNTSASATATAPTNRPRRHHRKVDSWGNRQAPANTPPTATSSTTAPAPATTPTSYAPLQFDHTIRTYNNNNPTPAPAPTTHPFPQPPPAPARPITPPDGDWSHYHHHHHHHHHPSRNHSAQSSSSDNGMAGWWDRRGGVEGGNSTGNGIGNGNGVGNSGGSGGSGGEATYQPAGGW